MQTMCVSARICKQREERRENKKEEYIERELTSILLQVCDERIFIYTIKHWC